MTDETVTAAQLNTHIRDNELALRAHVGCRAYKSANQTVASGNNDVVTWDLESFDTNAIHSIASNTSRFVVPSGFAGYWQFKAILRGDGDAVIDRARFATLRLNAAGVSSGGTALQFFSVGGHTVGQDVLIDWIGNLAAADYVECFLSSTSEARDILGGTAAESCMYASFLGD